MTIASHSHRPLAVVTGASVSTEKSLQARSATSVFFKRYCDLGISTAC